MSLFAKPIIASQNATETWMQIYRITIEGHLVKVILDSEGLFTLVYASLVDPVKLGKE